MASTLVGSFVAIFFDRIYVNTDSNIHLPSTEDAFIYLVNFLVYVMIMIMVIRAIHS